MKKGSTITTRSDTREKILETAGCLFAQKGFFGVSMRHIADELGITKAALYHHFESKEELCFEIMHRTFKELTLTLGNSVKESRSPSEALLRVVDAYLSFTAKRPQANLLFAKGSDDLSQRIDTLVVKAHLEVRQILEEIIAGILEKRKRNRTLVTSLTSVLLGFLTNPAPNRDESNYKEDAQNVINLILPRPRTNRI